MARAPASTLKVIKLVHTVVWAFFVAAIIAIPIAAWNQRFDLFAALSAVVLVEVIVLAMNQLRCPLTRLAARFTDDRQDNFDIFLPLWLARYSKQVFGPLFLVGIGFGIWCFLAR